jgi:hypothetical protein
MAADIAVRDRVAVAVKLQSEIFVNQSLDYVAMIFKTTIATAIADRLVENSEIAQRLQTCSGFLPGTRQPRR